MAINSGKITAMRSAIVGILFVFTILPAQANVGYAPHWKPQYTSEVF